MNGPSWFGVLGEFSGQAATERRRAKTSAASTARARRKRRHAVGGGENAWRRQFRLEPLESRELLSAIPTSIAITSSQEQAVYGQALVLTAAVSAYPQPPAGGTVVFHDGAAVLGSAAIDASGLASLGDVRLPAGAHDFSASYAGDATYGPSDSAAKLISTVAGGIGDGGPATAALLSYPYDIAVDAAGNQYIADTNNNVIRKVDQATGLISTVAGNGYAGYSGDGGLATEAQLGYPQAIAIDASGNLYIADTGNNVVRMVAPGGIIRTVAGTGSSGYNSDGGLAILVNIAPQGITVDSVGNLFIADYDNQRIRMVAPNGIMSTVAGNGNAGLSGDGGSAIAANLSYPRDVATDSAGNLFIAEFYNRRIRVVDKATGVISTVAGGGSGGDGSPALSAVLSLPVSIAIDSFGHLLIAEEDNHRVRKVTLGAHAAVPPAPLTITADNQSKFYGAAPPTLSVSYTGLVNGDTPAGLTTPPTLSTTADAASHVANNPYVINVAGAADPDYDISFVVGSLTVTPAPLTIAADNKSKVYGEALPPLTFTY